jgi:hypothetical protein
MEARQSARPVAVDTAPTADEELAELARLLEAKLRKPNVPAHTNPSSVPAGVGHRGNGLGRRRGTLSAFARAPLTSKRAEAAARRRRDLHARQ